MELYSLSISKRHRPDQLVRFFIISTIAIFALLLTACFHQPVTTEGGGYPLSIEIWMSDICAHPGDTIYARATMTNISSTTEVVEVKDRPVMDLSISSLAGTIRWSDTHSLTRLELRPQESKVIELQTKVESGVPSIGVTGTFITSSTLANYPDTLFNVIHVTDCIGFIGP